MSNTYTKRRALLPKPAVCAKKKRAYYLNALLHLDSLAPDPPFPANEPLVIHNVRLGGNFFSTIGLSPIFNAEATATFYPATLEWILFVRFTTNPPYGSGLTFTRTSPRLKVIPGPAGTLLFEFDRIDPDFEPGYLSVTIPDLLP